MSNEALAIACAFVLLIVGTGALADRNTDLSGQLVQRAAAAANRAGTYRFTTEQQLTGQAQRLSKVTSGVRFQGAVDIRTHIARLVTSIRTVGISANCTYITSGDDLFVSVHPSRQRAIGAAWLRTSSDSPLARANLQLRPDRLFDASHNFFKKMKASGTVVVRGVTTTRYRGTADIRVLVPVAADRTALGNAVEDLPAELDIGADDLLRRAVLQFRSGAFSVGIATDYFDYGRPLDIAKPPPGDVKDGNFQDLVTACYPTKFPGAKTTFGR